LHHIPIAIRLLRAAENQRHLIASPPGVDGPESKIESSALREESYIKCTVDYEENRAHHKIFSHRQRAI
jgi:hypothetical protein